MPSGRNTKTKPTIMFTGSFHEDLVIAQRLDENSFEAWIEFAKGVGTILATHEE